MRFCLCLVLFGCSSLARVPPPEHGAPAWVEAGSGNRREAGEARFIGIGVARPEDDATLAGAAADSRALAEVASRVDDFAARLLAAYAHAHPNGPPSDELAVPLSAAASAEAEVTERTFADDGRAYARAELLLSRLLSALPALEARAPGLAAFAKEVAPELFTGGDPASSSAVCTSIIEVTNVELTASDCFVDERVSGGPGVLTYPCDGGEAEAAFGNVRFSGRVVGREFELGFVSSFEYADGCSWQSHQELRGSFAGPVHYAYEETPVRGEACENPCQATASGRVR